MAGRRAAALALLALLVAGCDSSEPQLHERLPAGGSAGVVRIGLTHVLWPLDPTHARGRDELTLARMLFATPLRTDPETGALRPGLCSSWSASGTTWRLRCRHAGAIATQLRRVRLFPTRRIRALDERRLVIALPAPRPELLYLLTQVAAAPPGVPGPFRLISASPERVVAERRGLRLEVRKLEPHAALTLFRAGRLDEAPVPLGDLRAARRDSQLKGAVRVRRLLAADIVVFDRTVPSEVRRVYDATADRSDYQALVPEFEAPPAESLADRSPPKASAAVIALREARQEIPSLPRVAVRFARPADPDLAYCLELLVGAWRDLGLGAVVGGPPVARFERLLAPYPKAEALPAAVRGQLVVPIAWAVDARLVSPRLRGWKEDELGAVDYTRVSVP
ncbi:MAG: hypothetical protein M3R39_06625 [Actinomycetota bacterium]|nr:hypothetical protein [Actinomycetota bacterium]